MARNILVVLSNHNGATELLQKTVNDLYRPGDRLQLLWVTNHAELLKEAAADGFQEPQLPGLDADKSRAVEETEEAQKQKTDVAAVYGAALDAEKVPFQVHIVPTYALHLAGHIVQCAAVESAALVVLPKAASAFVKTYVAERCPQPLVLV